MRRKRILVPLQEDTPQAARGLSELPAEARTRVGNYKRLFLAPDVDGRSLQARRFKEVLASICEDLGGVEFISEGQRQLARRACLLAVEAEKQEAKWVSNSATFDMALYLVLTNNLRRIFQSLGLKRLMRDVGATPSHSLRSYLDS